MLRRQHPIAATDFASYLLQAQSTKPDVVGLCSVGLDLINAIKQAHEFGLTQKGGPVLATFLTYISDIHSLGLAMTGGLTFAESFYWDQTTGARLVGPLHGRPPRAPPPRTTPPSTQRRRIS